jgi:beta-N-acetylhexosaminidase
MVKKVFLAVLVVAGVLAKVNAQSHKTHWVDSVFNSLSIDERIGQLFMVTVPPHPSADALKEIEDEIKSHEIGGLIFQQGSPFHQAAATKRFQSISRIPLFVGQDAEWGLGQMIDSTISYPRALVLGAIKNDTLIYQMGEEIARQMKLAGLNLNFGPLADINNNPEDALISYRSFGENKMKVADKTTAFMRGLQDNGVLACAKHFTLQGLTIVNVENNMPSVQASTDSVRAFPYQKLFENNLTGVMPASSNFPLFYENLKLIKRNGYDASTLSLLFTGSWLKEKLNFKGLTFIDLQQVKVIAEKTRAGEAETFAFQAGNDILIGASEIAQAVRKIKKLIKSEQQYDDQLTSAVKKILAAKYDAGLFRKGEINLDNLTRRLNSTQAQLLKQKLYEAAITVIKNDQKVLPVQALENNHFAYVTSDVTLPNDDFYTYISKYVDAAYFTANDRTDPLELSDALANHRVIVVGIFPQTTEAVLERLNKVLEPMESTHQVIYCDFGNEKFLRSASKYATVVTAYTNTAETLKALPQVIFGALKADAMLPFTPSLNLKEGTGVETKSINRLTYSTPEDARMNEKTLRKIETIANEAIKMGATPGCQVFVARNGKVIYDRSFGSLTYDHGPPVTSETIYDLASLTKVSATLQAVMFMHEKGIIDIYKKVSYYLPELKNTNKKDITILEMLTHQAGLAPFIPMWTETVKDTVFLPLYYNRAKDELHPLQVSPNLFASLNIRDSVWTWIGKSKLVDKAVRTPYTYRYSDLGFLIFQRLAEKMLNQPLDEFVHQNLYEPLGAYTTGFKPLEHFSAQLIAPTEYDKIYRKANIQGTVHDERAAMMGGVAGHAGLFSNSNDLGKLGQMLLQEGTYGGTVYYKPETIRQFTNKQFDKSRRGLGWDKPIQSDWNSPTSLHASPKTFGHTGFTGTCLWVDPEFNLVYIFLSNRVYPDRNGKLITANIRSRIQDVIYESIFSYCDEEPAGKPEPSRTVISSRRN